VPQMADTDRLARALSSPEGVRYWGLVPNEKGYERAREAGMSNVSVVMSATETHNRKNLNRGRDQSMSDLLRIMSSAKADGVAVRAYVSVVFGCPYEGEVRFDDVLALADRLLEGGAGQVSFGDTIGVATPLQLRRGCRELLQRFEAGSVALHLHDTQGLGPANAFVAIEEGIETLDSSVGGLGGCPYAPGAAGNLGTEDLVHLAGSCGVSTGVELDEVLRTTEWIESAIGIEPASKLYRYRSARCEGGAGPDR